MAITISGAANTISGLAVGGLPDGVVDTDMLAAGAATQAKRTYAGNEIVQHVFAPYGDVNSRSSSNSGTNTSTGNHVDITPTNSSNLIIVGGYMMVYSDANNEHEFMIHNGTSVDSTYRTWTANLGSGPWTHTNFFYRQTAGTTSQMTFTLYHARVGGSGTAYVGWASSPGNTSNGGQMWAMEVKV